MTYGAENLLLTKADSSKVITTRTDYWKRSARLSSGDRVTKRRVGGENITLHLLKLTPSMVWTCEAVWSE